MGALGKKLRALEGGVIAFYCPGCSEAHAVKVEGVGAWTWNQNIESPTFSPSILLKAGHYINGKESCWCTYNAEHKEDPAPFVCHQCHSFVTEGKIQFLDDSTHKLAGQTVELPDWDDC